MAVSKKRVIKSLENLDEDLKDLVREQYPNGYEASITRISNGKKEPIFVFPIETNEATILIKVPVTKNSEGEYDVESGVKGEFESSEEDDFRSQAEDEFEGGGEDYDDEGGGGGGKEASYDPDFDN